jgi:DNA-binding LacI/PurR family transcriptional regulator
MLDVAESAGVSVQTVSNYINNRHGEMKPETRERVAAALSELGYRRNVAAASLRSQRTRTIGFLVVDDHAGFLADPLTDQLMAGIADVARDHAYGMLVQGGRPVMDDTDFFHPLREGRVDGVIIQLSGPRALRRRYIAEAQTSGVKAVVIDETGLPDGVLGVRAYQQSGARELTEHLLDAGHTRIAFLGTAVPWAVVEQREAGYRAALRGRGITPHKSWIVLGATYDAKGGEESAARLLEGNGRPTAIVCSSDLLAAGAMRAAKSLGYRIPADVAIAGFDDFEFSAYLDPPLTTVHVPAYEMGAAAAALLIDSIQGSDTVGEGCAFRTSLVVRGST